MDFLTAIVRTTEAVYLQGNKSYIFSMSSQRRVYITLVLKRRDYLLYKLHDDEVESIDTESLSKLFFTVHLRLTMDCDEPTISSGYGQQWFDNIINQTVSLNQYDHIPSKHRIEKMIEFIRKLYHQNVLNPIDLNDITKNFTKYPKLFTVIGFDESNYE